jgi:hypothetical protein
MNIMTLDATELAKLETDPEFLAYLRKDFTAGDVHTSSASGDKKPKPTVSGGKPKKPVLDFDQLEDEAGSAGTVAKALAEMERAHQLEREALIAKLRNPAAPDHRDELARLLKLSTPRALKPHTDGGAHSTFPYDPQSFEGLHDDQRRRFIDAMTHQDKQQDKRIAMSTLVALQPRIDPDEVESMRRKMAKAALKKPLVVRWNGRNYLADGHHRAAAAWLNGDDHIDAKFSDLAGKDVELEKVIEFGGQIAKVDATLGLVFGYAIVCKVDGEDYYDRNVDPDGERVPEHIPEDAMLKATAEFMEHHRVAKEMHTGDPIGPAIFAFPLTTDIAKALDIVPHKTGLLFAMKPSPDVLAKFVSGEYTGFSIGGVRIRNEDIE